MDNATRKDMPVRDAIKVDGVPDKELVKRLENPDHRDLGRCSERKNDKTDATHQALVQRSVQRVPPEVVKALCREHAKYNT